MVISQPILRIHEAAKRLESVVLRTPLQLHARLSERYGCEVWLKREDLQLVRSYKIRGAYNMMSSLDSALLNLGVVCASAGNHAQGFAYSCKKLNAQGVIFMPVITPRQKVQQVHLFGGKNVEVRLVGDTFDDCSAAAQAYTKEHHLTFIPPFDDHRIIEGQATVGLEILEDLPDLDFIFMPVGGGGLSSGVGTYLKTFSQKTQIIGVEPEGAPSMHSALQIGQPVTLSAIDRFVDGAAVKRVGDLTFNICKEVLSDMLLAPEGAVCTTILQLYNEDAIVIEPAGALSITALEQYANKIKGKKVVCIVSGSNNDIDRMPEIKERALQYQGLKHYYLIQFAQRPGALREFVNHVLGPNDDITRFEYIQKTNKEKGPALLGIELQSASDYAAFMERFRAANFVFQEINKDDTLFGYLV